MSALLHVHAPGLHTSVQDLGRAGFQHLGVPVSGALDTVALRVANTLVGNHEGEACLEILHLGPTLEVRADSVRIAIVGGDARIEVDDHAQPVRACQSVRLGHGERFRIIATAPSATAYLAVEGGLDMPEVLKSRSTYTRGGFGGHMGRTIQAGDSLALRMPAAPERPERTLERAGLDRPDVVRVVLGPQADDFTREAIETLCRAEYMLSSAADRMGMRLEGPTLSHRESYNIVSDGTAPGAIQVPGDGLPIILLADRQTTGGYPKIATVISSDLPGLGRLRPGDPIRFRAVTLEEACQARRNLKKWYSQLLNRIRNVEIQPAPDEKLLYGTNIISGVVSAVDSD